MSAVVPKDETFEKYVLIDRKPFADYLTHFLDNKANEGYVINLNAEWGAGKTTFLNCWYNELTKVHPTIYFDAWRSDFSKDAMLALIECFHAQLASPISDNKQLVKSLLTKGSYFIRKTAPSLAVGYLKHSSGLPEDESLIHDFTEQFNIDIDEKECGEALKEVLKGILEQKQRVEGIEEFKDVLANLAKAYVDAHQNTSNPKSFPVYVLIDELDRCRPNYAIDLIECVKHFFDTRKFVFVIATDTDQLQHSIKAIYGEGFDAHSYLSRFFHKAVTLPAPSIEDFLISRLSPIIGDDFDIDGLYFLDFLVNIFKWHNMVSLREIDKVLQDIEVAKECVNKSFKIIPLILLSIIRRLDPIRFKRYVDSREVPYRTEKAASSNDGSYFPINRNVASFMLSDNSKGSFEFALRYALMVTGKNGDNTPITEVGTIPPRDFSSGIEAICGAYRLNPGSEIATTRDYITVLNLAGHFD